ncbi:MAG: hypothetical protein JSS29_05360 [Proteobacteria bacterium]|nr:hypothetical protein [Pseudomonadota bacterium]
MAPKTVPFALLGALVSAAIVVRLPFVSLRTSAGTELMVVHSIRCALPFFIIAFSASSISTLWRGRLSQWLMRNRRQFGLTFALGMLWHMAFVLYFFFGFGKSLNRLALSLDIVGLDFVMALTLTSFRPIARHLSVQSWRLLHRTGMYVIWALATYLYLLDVKYYRDPLHETALLILLCAGSLRAAAWYRARRHN